MSVMSIEDIAETICAKWDVSEFVEYFEITIEEMAQVFKEKIQEHIEDLPSDLGMTEETYVYDDRSDD